MSIVLNSDKIYNIYVNINEKTPLYINVYNTLLQKAKL